MSGILQGERLEQGVFRVTRLDGSNTLDITDSPYSIHLDEEGQIHHFERLCIGAYIVAERVGIPIGTAITIMDTDSQLPDTTIRGFENGIMVNGGIVLSERDTMTWPIQGREHTSKLVFSATPDSD